MRQATFNDFFHARFSLTFGKKQQNSPNLLCFTLLCFTLLCFLLCSTCFTLLCLVLTSTFGFAMCYAVRRAPLTASAIWQCLICIYCHQREPNHSDPNEMQHRSPATLKLLDVWQFWTFHFCLVHSIQVNLKERRVNILAKMLLAVCIHALIILSVCNHSLYVILITGFSQSPLMCIFRSPENMLTLTTDCTL